MTRTFEPKLAARVARQIEADVSEAGWPVGQLFGSETELMERYGVGRAVVREAVRIVEHHKVASMRRGPSGGLIVQAPDATPSARALMIYLAHAGTTVPDLVHARLLLEPMTAGLTARALTEEGIERLRGLLDREETLRGRPGVEVQDELHVLLGELSGNPALALFVAVLAMLTRHYAEEKPPTEAANRRAKVASHRAHAAIVEATIAGDAALAENRVAKHLRAMGAWLSDGPRHRPGHRGSPPGRPVLDEPAAALKLAEVVADRIRLDIMGDKLAEGDLVASEQELLNRYEISRAVLREAVRLLEYHSVAVMRRGPGGGLFVTRPDPSASVEAIGIYLDYQGIDLDALGVVRTALELGCVELLVARRDEPGVAERLRAAAGLDVLPEDQPGGPEFHTELAALAGNPVLQLFLRILAALTDRLVATSSPGRGGSAPEPAAELGDPAHRAIAEAVLAGDTAVAKFRLRRHLEGQQSPRTWWH